MRFQYGRDFEYEISQVPTAYEQPLANNNFGRPAFICISANTSGTGCSLVNGIQLGKAQFLERAAYPDERRTQVADTVSWTHGRHNLKFGVDYNHVPDYINNLYNENGAYIYNNTGDYFADYLEPHHRRGPGQLTSRTTTDSCRRSDPAVHHHHRRLCVLRRRRLESHAAAHAQPRRAL